VGARVNYRRRILGLTQEWVGERLNITFQGYQKYESGVTRISAGCLFRLSKILKVPSVDYFFEGLSRSVSQPAAQQEVGDELPGSYLDSRDCFDFNRAFMNVRDPEIRRHILRLVKGLSARSIKTGEEETSAAAEAAPLEDA
jgi:transcriptional regulator with XRE-family HTH domain